MKPLLCALLFLAVAHAQSFEVATIKPSSPEERAFALLTYPGGRIMATNYTLKMLIHEAYQIDDPFIQGGPAWAAQTPFSLNAIPPANSRSASLNPSNPKLPPPPEELAMLRNLLAERFRLKVREETREGDVFILTVDRAGHKLKPPKDAEAFPYLGRGYSNQPGLIRGANATMEILTRGLTDLAGRLVLDRTGLQGAFDIEFEYARGLTDSPLPSLSGALQEIGLRLTSAKGPVRYIVIEQAELPSGN
jgi:uncharacterized protein (TIGR03435 family)